MNPTPLSEDIAYAISCVQDYKYSIEPRTIEDVKMIYTIDRRIERLFQFYYQLVGFDPNNIRKVALNEID